MSNESLTCSNSSFIVDLPILTPSSSTLLVVETHSGGGVEIGKVSLPEALLRSGIPLTGTQIDTWVQSNSCNVAAATAWFLVNNVKTSRNNTWVANTSSYILSATNWVANNSARLNNLDFTIDGLTDNAIQAGTWFTENSTNLQSLSSDILSLSSDGASLQAFASWIVSNSSTLNNTVTSLTSLLVEEALEETFHNWVISNSSVFGTMLTTLRDLTGDESFIRNASQWVSSVSADVDQTVSWFKVLTSVRELHEVVEMSVFAWVTGNSAEISDILEKNSNGFLSWVSANSAEYQTVYNWYVDNEQSIQNSITWTQEASSRVDILEGSIAVALETAIDANTWISNNTNTYATIGSVEDLATWISNNSTTLNDIQEWYGTLPTTATAIQGAVEWITVNGDNVIEAAQWLDTLVNSQLLHDNREDQVLAWVEGNSADLNTEITDPNATIALAWATSNSATILQAVNWVHLLTSTQETHEQRESAVFNWVESHSGDNINEIDLNVVAWVQDSSSTLTNVKEWYEFNQLDANVINPTINWVNNISGRLTQATEWVEVLTEVQEQHGAREAQVLSWVESTSGSVEVISNWVESASTTLNSLDLITPFVESFKDSAEWYTVSGELINSAAEWVASVTSSWVSQIQLEAVRLIFNPTKTWIAQNSGVLTDVTNFTTSISADLNRTINWVEETSTALINSVSWIEDVSASVAQIDELVVTVNNFTETNTWVQSNSDALLVHSDTDINLFDDVATYVATNSGNINTALDDINLLKITYEDFGTELEQTQLSVTSTASSAVSALQWVRENEDALLTIAETADNLTDIINTLTPTTNWAGRVSSELAQITTWVENNSTLAEVNNILDNATAWVTQSSSEIESAINWVSILTSTQQLHDNREENIFAWVEYNSAALVDVDNTNLDWLNQNKGNIDSNITWVVDNSGKVQESYLATRAYNTQINNLTTWLTGNSAQLKDAAEWVNTTSADINIAAIQDTIEWVSTNGETLPLRVETLETAIDGLPELQQWFSETDTQLLTAAANWVSITSGSVNTLEIRVESLSTIINTLSSVVSASVSNIEGIATWVGDSSATITQTTEWVQMLTSTQQLHDARESSVFTWVETHSSDNTVVDENLIVWVQNNSGDLVDVKDWYSNKTFDDSKVNETITWYQDNSAKATEAIQWVVMLAETQGLHDVEEEQVFAWVQENSSSIQNTQNNVETITWVQSNSNTVEYIANWNGFEVLNVDQVNAATTIVSETSALAEKTAQWVQALSSAQNLHDLEEDQVFAWVQTNSGNTPEGTDSQSDTWVRENSSNIENVTEWFNNTILDIDQVNAATTIVRETSALSLKTAQWVQALSSAQNLHDLEEDQVFTWVQSNSGSIAEGTDSQSDTWVRENSGSLEDVVNWNGFEVLNVDQINEVSTIVSETSALAEKTAQWVQALSSAQNLHDVEEDQVFAWVQTNSSNIQDVSDSTDAITWVQANSNTVEDIASWNGFEDLNVDQINETITWYQENSAKAAEAVQWIEMLTQAQNVDDAEEEQVITWVQENSSSIISITDTQPNTWVRENSNNIEDVVTWSGFENLNVDQVNTAVTWVNETSALAEKTAQWVQALSSAQNLHDLEEDQIFAWVQTNSGNVQDVSDSADTVTWVQANSNTVEGIASWSGFEVLNVDQINEVSTIVSETSALAEKTAQWVQALSSAQNLHDVEEDQVFAWVQTNSGNISEGTDSQSDTWVRENSGDLIDVKDWFSSKSFDDNKVNETITWYQENSAKATEAIQWIEILSEAQNVDDAEEEQVITWVQTNSSSIQNTEDSIEAVTWVQSNSNNIENVVNWNGFEVLNVDQINEVSTIVSETSALAEKTAQWVQALSSAQNLHDVEEDQVFAWVQTNSGNIQDVSDSTDAVTWVQSNSNTIEDVTNWNGFEDLNVDQINETITWYQENSAKATEAIQWIEMLTEAQNVDDAEEEQVITWVQENSSSIQDASNNVNVDTWVQVNSSDIENVTEWFNNTILDINQVNAATTIVSETSALALKTAQWVQTLSSAQNIHDLEEDQVFAWVQNNSSNVQDVSDNTDATTWVQSNSNNVEDLASWSGFEDLNVDQVNTAVTWVNETSALAEKTAQWVQALSSAQNLHDVEEDQVFAWVQENSGNISEGTSSQSDTWVQANSNTIEDVVNWNGFEDLNVDQVNAATTWYQENSARATEAVEWIEMLTVAQNVDDAEEEQVITWVQSNSGSIAEGTDSQSDTWVRENSNNIENVVNWNGFEVLNVNQINEVSTIVSETSALAEKTAQWVQALSSAQNLHDVKEDQVFAWVQENSSNIQDVSDSTDATTWVQANSNTVEDIANWSGFEGLNVDQVNETITWYQENSAKASEAVQWIEMLTEAQNVDDAEEEQVITWVQENSSSISEGTDSQSDTWVRENSNNIEDIASWSGFEVLNVDQVNAATTIVSETSALAEKTAQWVQALSSAQNLHDLEEDQVFAWVQTNSGNEQAVLTSADVNTWVQGNSSKLSAVEAWYDENHPDTATLNSAVDWYSTYGAKAVQATEWVDMLAEANNLHDAREESVLAWVEAHSGDITEGNNLDANLVTWVQDHSTSLNNLEEEWNIFTDLDIDHINAATTIVSETSALAEKTAQWVQALSSAQNLHDAEEDQVFAWVQENSSNVQDVSDSTDATTWVQSNSNTIEDVVNWSGFEDLNVDQVNKTITWYQENSARSIETSQWVEMLAEANNLNDARETAVFAWVEANSGNISTPIDSQSDTWVEANSGALADVKDWFVQGLDSINDAVTLVNETSALAARTSQWVQVLSSAQNLHEGEESQVFAWVQSNSDNVQDVSDSTEAVTWVQENSNTLYSVEQWVNSNVVTDSIEWVNTNNANVNNAVTWFQENSTQASEAVQWIEMLSEAQNIHDEREESVITWVEENSGNLTGADTTANVWVQTNSSDVENVLNWNGFTELNADSINPAVVWVNETSALATKAAEWVQILSSALDNHDVREEQVLTWVETSSGINMSNSVVNTWVRGHSSKLTQVEAWYNENHPETGDLNNVVDWYGTYGARAAEATEWVEMLAEAQNNHEPRETAVFTWVEANSGNVDDVAQDVNTWVKANSSAVDTVVEFVESNHDALTSLENWYTTRIADEVATASAVSWVQHFSARTAAASLWIETISSIEEGHEQFETQIHTWVSENSGLKTKVGSLNAWVTGTSGFTLQVDNWVALNSSVIGSFVVWWQYLVNLDNQGHIELEEQVHTWVTLNSARYDATDTWVRDHSSGLIQAETWVECTTAFFRSLSSWAVSSSANYDATYTWVSGTSARVLSAVIWVEQYKEPLEGLYNFYHEKEDIITDIIFWYNTRHVIDDDAGDFVQEHKDAILDNIIWVNEHRVEIENTITWANTSSAKYERAYTWVRDHSTQVQEDHNILIDLQEEVANLYQWVYVYPGPWLINAATTVSANSGNGGVDWSIDTVGEGGGSDCECIWDKVEPITNPLGMLTYNEVLTGKTLKWILEQILYTQALRITINPSSSTVCPDTTVTFYVSAGPEGPVQYAWYKNDVYIGGSGGTTTNGNVYSIQSAGPSDVGEYYAIATYGTKSLTSLHATVSLKELLVFTEDPINTTLNTGQTLRLSAEIEGTAPINFVWLKNGTPIAGATNTQYYTRINAATSDSGTYKVSASNACGSAISQEAIVNVYAPVVITLNPVTLTTVNSNSPVTLNTAATGSLPITYKWLSGSNAQSITDEIVGASTPTYTAQNSGVYVMVACNMVNCATSTPATIAYNIPPSVTILPSITSVRTGTSLTISAIEITGSPTPTLQWYKNNILIGNATSSKYDINSIQTDDEAIYTLSASNIAGTASDTSVVYVWSLQIARDPIGTAINPGATWTMYSSAIGTAPIVYYWAKDGIEIPNTNYTSYEAGQGGTYVLVASNAFGVLSSEPAIITVNIAPMISLAPETTSVLTGTTLFFDGTLLAGTQTVTYKWLKDGVVIPGITTIDYTKYGLTVGDSGTYTLCATNMVGSASAQSTLIVNQGLQWTIHPTGSTINPGQSHTMTVSAYGTEPITYSWLSGSNTGNITTVISQAAEGNRSLTTTASGYYRSIASNFVGSITSNSAQVLFNIAPRITLTPASTSVLTNTQLKFDGTLIEGTPTITYKWLKNGVEIVGAPNSEDYTKTGLTVGDSGTYTLCATNMVGSASAESVLVVNQALGWITQPAGSAINPGQSYTMFASASGTEPITYRWLSGSSTGNITTQIGTNPTFATTASGYYKAVANNTVVGSITSVNALVTFNTLQIAVNPHTQNANAGDNISFISSAVGTPVISYKWYKNGSVITNATGTTLTLNNVQEVDEGNYVLVATNIVGSVSSTIATLTVNTPLTYTMYWGKFFDNTVNGNANITTTDTTFKNLNTYYSGVRLKYPFPLGKYTSNVVAVNNETGFPQLTAATFADAFQVTPVYTRTITSKNTTQTISFTSTSLLDFSEYEAAFPTKPKIDNMYKTISNGDLWIFVPSTAPGTRWTTAQDTAGNSLTMTYVAQAVTTFEGITYDVYQLANSVAYSGPTVTLT